MKSTATKVSVKPEVPEEINIYNNKYVLIDSNSIILFDIDEPIEIDEVFSNSFTVIFRIISEKDETCEQKLEYRVVEGTNTIEFKCLNFINSLGTGTVKPIEVGMYGGKKFYIHFWIYALGGREDVTRKLEYSIWMER